MLRTTLAVVALLSATAAQAAEPPAPLAPRPVQDTYFGKRVDDPYRFLERTDDPEVAAWMRAQSDYTRAVLDGLPERAPLLERINTFEDAEPARIGEVRRRPGGLYFYEKRGRSDDQFKLYLRRGLKGKEILLVDPEAIAGKRGKPHAINYYEPSMTGRYVAYGISAGGSEDASLFVFDTRSGRNVLGPVARADYGAVQWLADDSGFFFVRLQKLQPGMDPTEKYQKSRALFVRLGADPEAAPTALAHDTPGVDMDPVVEAPFVGPIHGTPYAGALIFHGTNSELTFLVAPLESVVRGRPAWRKVFDRSEAITGLQVVGDRLFVLTHNNAPRYRVLETSLAKPDFAHARVVMAEASGPAGGVIDGIARARDALYIKRRDGAVSRLFRLPLDKASARVQEVKLPQAGSFFFAGTDHRLPGVLIEMQSWTEPQRILAVDGTRLFDTGLQPRGNYGDLSQYVATEILVPSHDGAKVPLSIVHRRGLQLDGNNPTLLWGYASYGVTEEPWFSPWRLAWLERGGVWAVANPRGSGAFGESWYKSGYQATKPNTWKDFIACAEYLVTQKVTVPAKLGIWGGSAGGILVGRALTTRPDLFAAVVSSVGVNDLVRAEITANGLQNVPEFGTVKTEAGFDALLAMSTYHHIADGTPYPAVLLTHGVNDPRVDVWQSTKAAAALQAATSSGRPVLLRLDYDAGHGVGDTKKQIRAERADVLAFLLWQFRQAQR
ncbi:MAG TPA: prolyl oligopeptidase family serine peptidase [Burkholderiaceae bacterium]|nr:prolyl oligopeptidase family serine peptidase [Burkholderiaceae bacterium]